MDLWVSGHRFLLEWTIMYIEVHSFIALGYWEIWEAFQGLVFLGTIEGVGGTWWHCNAAVISIKALLLGCGAKTMDRSVLKETNLGIHSTPA